MQGKTGLILNYAASSTIAIKRRRILEEAHDKKGARQLKRLMKPAQKRAINEDLQVPGAADIIAKLEKDMAKLNKRVKALESRTDKLWADKLQRDIAMTQEADNEATRGS